MDILSSGYGAKSACVCMSGSASLRCKRMGPDTAWMVMAALGCRQALGGADPLLVGIKARGIWLQRSSKNSK